MIEHSKLVDKSKVVLVTSTFYTSMNDPRVPLALKMTTAAREHGYRLIVVDGSPCDEFKIALRHAGAEVIDQVAAGMGASRRQVLTAGLATRAEVLIWLEPEKYPLIPLLEPCIKPVQSNQYSVVIPRRRSLESYPRYQAWSEYQANWILGEITGRPDLDFYIGPRIMDRKAAQIMASYQPNPELGYNDNWEILFLPLLEYLKQGTQVIRSVTIDYVHPTEQLIEDDESIRAKRDKQRVDLVTSMTREAQRLDIKGL